MEKRVECKDIAMAYKVLAGAKYQKMSDDDRVKIWKITRALKAVAVSYESDVQSAQKELMPDDEFSQNFQKARQYEQMKAKNEENLPMSESEYNEFVELFKGYQTLVNQALEDIAKKEIALDFEPISEEAFGQLMASNDWTLEQASALGEVIVEQKS